MELFVFLSFLFWINVIAFWTYAMDKRYAYYSFWRIPEAVLIILAGVGGAYGAMAAMLLFRHKTRHLLFTITVPLCFIMWLVIAALAYGGFF